MYHLFGRDWTREELLRRVGHMDQLAGMRLVEGADGRARGSRMLDVWTGGGLEFTVAVDRALDITACRYRGTALAWLSPAGEAHPAYYEPQGLGWLRSFAGGLLTTCGLDHFGAPSDDEGQHFGLHGRVSNLAARYLYYEPTWSAEGYRLEIRGEVRQARLFGENLVLRRRITTALGARSLHIEDTVTNEGHAPQPHMILYHFNMGFPLVSEDARLRLEADLTEPRDADAAPGLSRWSQFEAPTPGYREQVFHHMPRADGAGKARVELENRALGLGLRWTYDRAALPHLFEWKMMGEGAYVVGVEPANSSGIGGRADARAKGDLPMLAPGETRVYAIDLEVVEY